jgi:chromosome partitioning protein
LSQLLQTVATVKSQLNPELTIHGIVLTMHDARNNLSNQVVADVRANSKQKVYDTVIPRNVRVSEAPSYGKPVLVYDLKCVGSEAYLRLATEIIQREKELMAVSSPAENAIDSDQRHGAA